MNALLSLLAQPHWRWALRGLLALALLPLGWALYGPRGVMVEVQARPWRMEIDVEQQVMETGSDWCSALPPEASQVSRRTVDGEAHCRYSAPQWRRRWVARNEGEAPAPARWPAPDLSGAPPGQLGAQRLGKHLAFHELQLQAGDGRQWLCPLPLPQWQRIAKGDRFRIQVDRHGTADCASIPPR